MLQSLRSFVPSRPLGRLLQAIDAPVERACANAIFVCHSFYLLVIGAQARELGFQFARWLPISFRRILLSSPHLLPYGLFPLMNTRIATLGMQCRAPSCRFRALARSSRAKPQNNLAIPMGKRNAFRLYAPSDSFLRSRFIVFDCLRQSCP